MKNFLLFILVFLSLSTIAQNYHLFPSNSNRIYTIPSSTDTCYEISFDSVISENNIITYYNYYEIGDWMESEVCYFWGGQECYEQNKNSWIGYKIVQLSDFQYLFFNNDGDTIDFDFDPNQSEPYCFYEDEEQSFYIEYQGEIQNWVLGASQMIRTFVIYHYDADGNIIDSPLNDSPINIAESFGLVTFFKIDEFPNQLQRVELIGFDANNAGFNHINESELHSHEIGDEIQYEEMYYTHSGPPFENYIKFTKYIYLNKNIDGLTTTYEIQREIFYEDSTNIAIDTITKSYSIQDTLYKLPFQKPIQYLYLRSKRLSFDEYGEIQLPTYKIEHQYLEYCAEDNCWGFYDTNGPPENEKKTYVMGLGLFHHSESVVYEEGYYFHNKIVFFKKYDETWGQELILGTNHIKETNPINVYPQPSTNYVTFSISNFNKIDEVLIFDFSGKLIETIQFNSNQQQIDVGQYNSGIYFYQAKVNHKLYRGKFSVL